MRSWLNKVVNSTKKRPEGEGGSNEGSHRGYQYGSNRSVSGGEDLIKAQLISRISEQLVREIQRILRSAKEAQAMYGGNRWAGTTELLTLLSGGGTPGPLSDEKFFERDDSDDEMDFVEEDFTAAAEETKPLTGESFFEHDDSDDSSHNQNLLGALVEFINNPHFIPRCLEVALAPNLCHCLRLMRIIELENASAPSTPATSSRSPVTVTDGNSGNSSNSSTSPNSSKEPATSPAPPSGIGEASNEGGVGGGEVQSITAEATLRICKILLKLCEEGAVVEQLRNHLEGLFKLTTCGYPSSGLLIQRAAYRIIRKISTRSLTSSLVWYIHERNLVMEMAVDMNDLCRGSSDLVDATGPTDGSGAKTGAELLLSGMEAEEAGLWYTSLRALVTLVCNSCRYSAALLSDLEQQEAHGYDVIKYMVLYSSANRRPEMLAKLVRLVGASVENDRHGSPSDAMVRPQARNIAAFEVIKDVLIDGNPILSKMMSGEEERNSCSSDVSSLGSCSPLQSPKVLNRQESVVAFNLATVSREAISFLRTKGQRTTDEDRAREQLHLHLLDAVLQTYSNHPRNYSILEPRFHVLSLFLALLSSFRQPDLKILIIKTLEYVCSGVANCVPTHAIYAACFTFMSCCEHFLTAPPQTVTDQDLFVAKELLENIEMLCGTLEKLIQFDHQFIDMLCTSGVLGEVFYPLLSKAVQLKDRSLPPGAVAPVNALPSVDDAISYVCRILTMMLQESPLASSQFFRAVRLHHVLYGIITDLGPRSTQAALRVLQLCALGDSVGLPEEQKASVQASLTEDLTCLIELLQSCRHQRWRQLVVLKVVKDILNTNSMANDLWRTQCGFEAVVAALSSLDGAFKRSGDGEEGEALSTTPEDSDDLENTLDDEATPTCVMSKAEEDRYIIAVVDSADEQEISLELIKFILRVITVAVSGKVLGNLRARVENRQYLKNEIGYDTLKCCLLNSGVLTRERFARDIVECIFMMVTEEHSLKYDRCNIKNADAVLLLFSLLTELPKRVAIYILQKLLQLISNSTYVSTEQLCIAGALRTIVVQFRDILHDPDDPLYPLLLRLLCLSGRHRITVPDAVSILRCLAKPLFRSEDGDIVLCSSYRRQKLLHPEMGPPKTTLEEQWKSLLILAELAETSDSVPFLRMGGSRFDLLSLSRKWAREESKELPMMEYDAAYAATAYSEGMRFVMIPTVGAAQVVNSSGFTYSCWFRFGVEDSDFIISEVHQPQKPLIWSEDSNKSDGSEGNARVNQRIIWLLTVSSVVARSVLHVYFEDTPGTNKKELTVETYGPKGDSKRIEVELQPGEWHNLVLVYSRGRNILSNRGNTLAVYVDGLEVEEPFRTEHMSFLETPSSRCFIGVPLPDTLKEKETVLQGVVSPIWHLGPVMLISEALPVPQAAATAIYAAGPGYIGSFQGERPAHKNLNSMVTALLHRLHHAYSNTQDALESRGLHDVLRHFDHRRDDDAYLNALLLRIPLEQLVFSFHAGNNLPCEITPRSSKGQNNLDIYHEPCYRLVNTVRHLFTEDSRSQPLRSQWGVVFGDGVLMNPLSISDSVFGMGSPKVLFPLLEVADSPAALCIVLELIRVFCKGHMGNLNFMQHTGYRVVVFLLTRKKHLFNADVLKACVALAIDNKVKNAYHGKLSPDQANATGNPEQEEESTSSCSKLLVDSVAFKHLALNWELWSNCSREIFIVLLTLIHQLLDSNNPNAVFNSNRLHNLGLVRWTLSVMMQAAKLSALGTPGWSIPRVTFDEAHWGRASSAPGDFLSLCAKILQSMLLIKLTEHDVSDMAAVLLGTVVTQGSSQTDARHLLFNVTCTSPRTRARVPSTVGISTATALKDSLSPQAVVRVCLLEVLINVLTREHELGRKTNYGGAQGMVKKVIDFFANQEAMLAAKASSSFLMAKGAMDTAGTGGQTGGTGTAARDDRQELYKALVKSLSPEWFLCMIDGSADSVSVSLLLRALFVLFQEREDYVQTFSDCRDGQGFSSFSQLIPKHSASPIVLLPLFAILIGLPLSQVPILPDLKQMRVYEIISPIETSYRITRGVFGPLMNVVMSCLGKNTGVAKKAGENNDNEDDTVSRSRYCVEEVLTTLKNALEVSQPFREACRSREFIYPMVQTLFACADQTELEMAMEHTRRLRTSTGADIPLNSLVQEDYIQDSKFTASDKTRQVESHSLTPSAAALDQTPTAPPRPYFAGPEASKLLRILNIILRDSIFSQGSSTLCSVPTMVKETLLAFPYTAEDVQVYSFQEAFLQMISDLIKESLTAGDSVPISNAVAIAGVLFEHAHSGLFSPANLTTALEMTLKITREVSGTRINKSLGNELQQLLLADAVSIAQAFTIVALRRCLTYNEKDTGALLNLINSHIHLLLVHTKKPTLPTTTTSSSQRVLPTSVAPRPTTNLNITNIGWRRALASTLSGNLDDPQEGASSPTTDVPRSMANILRGEPSKVDVFSIFAPEREEAFVTCLMAEMRFFLCHENVDTRRNAFRTCDILLRQRQSIMKELLMPEVRDRKTKERRVLDIYTKGFLLLQEPQAASVRAIGEDDAMANVKFRRFEYWLENDASEDVQQVFRTIQDRASAILGDEQISTPEVIDRLKGMKVQTLAAMAPTMSTRPLQADFIPKALETFMSFYQHIIRAGLSDLAYGSVHWKRTLNTLRGVGSIWEGSDADEEKQDAWGALPSEPGTPGGKLTKSGADPLRWKLDMTEGPERMRRRLKRNFEFGDVYMVLKRPELKGLLMQSPGGTEILEDDSRAMDPSTSTTTGESTMTGDADELEDDDFKVPDELLPEGFNDFRATAKLIKQVALVRRTSQRGKEVEDENDFIDEDDEEDVDDDDDLINRADEIDLTVVTNDDGETELAGRSPTGPKKSSSADLGREEDRGAVKPTERSRSPHASQLDLGLNTAAADEENFDRVTSFISDDTVDSMGVTDPIDAALVKQQSSGELEDSTCPVMDTVTEESLSSLQAAEKGSLGLGETASPVLFGMEEQEPRDLVCNELIAGFVEEGDGQILRVYNVQRCTGLEVKPALLLFCRHTMILIDGFAKLDSSEMHAHSGYSIKRVPVHTSSGSGGSYSNAKEMKNAGQTGSALQRYSVYLRDPDSETRGEFYSDAVRVNRVEKEEDERGEDGTGGGEVVDPYQGVGFDLDEPPHVERIRLERLRIMYKRRYQFRHVGLEIFDVDGRSCLLAFETSEDQVQVVDLILEAPIINSVFFAEGHKLGGGKINYKRFMQHYKSLITSRWQAGRLTNFEYLMHLNALAGRSFHDLTQYPVFPWILSDYTSEELDLEDPDIYRPLDKPMGALGEARAKQFRERFEALAALSEELGPEEAENEPPAFHYGTHYSCAGYTLYYLLRLEPYTRLHLALQGGKFDKSDRLFRDIKSSWESASRDNLQDVRELTPEFFYLPDFLVNTNGFDFGWLQKGQPVNHVSLPPWAKGDAREFVRIHRMALESKYVSEHLHQWIDLIFGYKQQGKEAVEAQNLFVHLTYEGVVDIDAIQDPVIREATLAQIHNFGQTPSRLFKRPHPARRVPVPVQGLGELAPKHVDPSALAWHQHTSPPLCIVGAPQHLALRVTSFGQIGTPYGGALPDPCQPVSDVWILKDKPIGVGLDCALVPPSLVKYARYGSPDNGITFRVAVTTTRHRDVDRVVSVHEQLHLAPVNCMVVEENGDMAVTGSKDSTIRVWSLSKTPGTHHALTLQATLSGHTGEVLCLDLAPQIGSLVSGGADRLAIVWDIREMSCQRYLSGHTAPVTSVSINKRTGDILTLAGVDIRLWTVTGELLAQVSSVAVVKDCLPSFLVATSCPEWQNGVVAITGHDNGKVCLWSMQPLSSDIDSSVRRSLDEGLGTSMGAASLSGALTMAGGGGLAPLGRQLKVMQILQQGVHVTPITAIRVGRDQRDIVVGDASGRLSRWSSVKLDSLTEKELAELFG